ncbi:MAG: hypothetical protein OEW90_01030 [Betaproteobacteria bacterium]|nr:hypothetical protein [Betaproteobacteria bacterium]MDH4322701.1 hypothetical protein [Betaproteobacteria bacterium]
MTAGLKQQRQTNMIELAETHNIARSIARIRNQAGSYDNGRWKRALYHALGIAGTATITLSKVREALELP